MTKSEIHEATAKALAPISTQALPHLAHFIADYLHGIHGGTRLDSSLECALEVYCVGPQKVRLTMPAKSKVTII